MLLTIENRSASTANEMQNILRAKCVVLGDPTVGKSCIVQAFTSESSNFQKKYLMTFNVALEMKKVSVPDTDDVVELFIYDCSGKDLYSDVQSQLWNHASLICIVFDVTNEKSFQNCSLWLNRIRKVTDNLNIPGVLIGNKIDLVKQRTVTQEDALKFAQNNSLRYLECSTKENSGVEEPFFFLVSEWHKLYLEKAEMFKMLS